MSINDLQIGSTYTNPQYRSRGLAQRGLMEIVNHYQLRGRKFWYLTDINNIASNRVAEKSGFTLKGVGLKKPRLGSLSLGYYKIKTPKH